MLREHIDHLDEIWAAVVKECADWTCEHCKIKGVRMEAAHVVGRRHRTTRWGTVIDGVFDLCGHCFCHNCHQQYDEHGPLEPAIVEKTIGRERKEKLQYIATVSIAKHQDVEEIERLLQEKLDGHKDFPITGQKE